MDSWTNLMYQIFKIYLLNRCNPKSFKTLPGMDPDKTIVDSMMAQSNIFSVPETILLKWLQVHFNAKNIMAPRKVVNFDNDLADGIILAYVIQAHCGNLKSLVGLKPTVHTEE
ncbi:MAG: hypothetical protein V2I33_19840 [Kangiellaceae bacterium]|nr:hypothetical protein [Kangiellaceae bacterium]